LKKKHPLNKIERIDINDVYRGELVSDWGMIYNKVIKSLIDNVNKTYGDYKIQVIPPLIYDDFSYAVFVDLHRIVYDLPDIGYQIEDLGFYYFCSRDDIDIIKICEKAEKYADWSMALKYTDM